MPTVACRKALKLTDQESAPGRCTATSASPSPKVTDDEAHAGLTGDGHLTDDGVAANLQRECRTRDSGADDPIETTTDGRVVEFGLNDHLPQGT